MPSETLSRLLGWGAWVLPVVPTLVVIEHTVFLWLTRPRLERGAAAASDPAVRYEKAFERVERSLRGTFSLRALVFRYGPPAMLVGLVAFALFTALFASEGAAATIAAGGPRGRVMMAARLGAVGAYLWILLYMGRRAIRHDLTSGGTTASAVTLVLGTTLAGALGYLWTGELRDPGGAASGWGAQAVFLLAGLAPQRIAVAVQDGLRRLWLPESAATPVPARIVPLTQVRGITPDIEERLGEEGIYDVATLAMADPLVLFRNTSFDLRQIVSWMDEALLIHFLPEGWEPLQKAGISGAIDLAWTGDQDQPALAALAEKVRLEAALLSSAATRLSQDAQVQLVWILYQNGSPDAGSAEGTT